MSTVYLCSCVFPRFNIPEPTKGNEELEHLLESGLPQLDSAKKHSNNEDIHEVLKALDVFKGILVFFMTYSHVDLVLVDQSDSLYGKAGHFIGNCASSLCFLGFMFAYGFACDCMYLSDWKLRSPSELRTRVCRSMCLPLCGALVCSFAWSFLCFKFPLTFDMVASLLTFYNLVGNGPDFIVCFATVLFVMFPGREFLNRFWDKSMEHRFLLSTFLLIVPQCFTLLRVHDCTGRKKYVNMFLECTVREPWSANLPALPHLFYFNLGLIAARFVRQYGIACFTTAYAVTLGVVFATFCVPLYSVWNVSYGNIMVKSEFGMVTRGFIDGPSPLWLLGNLFALYMLLWLCWFMQRTVWLKWFNMELQHLGANILLYLVIADIILAGAYRLQAQPNDPFPLRVFPGGFVCTLFIFAATRFIHYLANSSRK